jgi:hypothetical protein
MMTILATPSNLKFAHLGQICEYGIVHLSQDSKIDKFR